MIGENERLQLAIQLLGQEMYNCSWYFAIVKVLGSRFEQTIFTKGERLLKFSWYACRRETLLSLSRIYFKNDDSITFRYILDIARTHPSLFQNIDKEQILQLITKTEELLESKKGFFEKIKPIRNMTLAHLDRDHINNPDKIFPDPVAHNEIENCVQDFVAQISEIMGAFDGSGIPEIDPEVIIQDQLKELLT